MKPVTDLIKLYKNKLYASIDSTEQDGLRVTVLRACIHILKPWSRRRRRSDSCNKKAIQRCCLDVLLGHAATRVCSSAWGLSTPIMHQQRQLTGPWYIQWAHICLQWRPFSLRRSNIGSQWNWCGREIKRGLLQLLRTMALRSDLLRAVALGYGSWFVMGQPAGMLLWWNASWSAAKTICGVYYTV